MAKDFPKKLSKANLILLALIIIFAAGLRFYRLGEIPVSLSGDEVDIAYNSFSLLKTGRDISGHFLPVSLQTIIDSKPALMAYFLMLPIQLGGLTEFSIRFFPALIGLLTIPLIYLLVRELFKTDPLAIRYSLLASLLLAVSPWHLHFSRGVFEVMLAGFLLLLGIYCFLVGLKKPKFLLIASLSFVFSLYAYHSTRLIVPLILVGLVIFYLKEFRKRPRSLLILSAALFFLLCLPVVVDWVAGPGQSRFNEVALFKNQDLVSQILVKRAADRGIIFGGRLFHNKLISFGKAIIANYLVSFSPQFLFLGGDLNPRHHAGGGFGQFYVPFFLFWLLGLYVFLKKKETAFRFLLFWLLVSPVASVVTIEGGNHAVRLFLMVFPLTIIMALGLEKLLSWSGRSLVKKGIVLGIVLGLFLDLTLFLHQYFFHWPQESWRWWQYGYREAMAAVRQHEEDYDLILVNNSYEPSVLWFLFWNRVDPIRVQKELADQAFEKNVFPGLDGFRFDKFWFVRPNSSEWRYGWVVSLLRENKNQKILFLASHEKDTGGDLNWEKKPPQGIRVLETIYSPEKQPIFYLLANQ